MAMATIDRERFARAIEQIALAYKFKAAEDRSSEDVFDLVVPAARPTANTDSKYR